MKRRDAIAVLVAGSDQDASRGQVEMLQSAGFMAEFAPLDENLTERVDEADWDVVLLDKAGVASLRKGHNGLSHLERIGHRPSEYRSSSARI